MRDQVPEILQYIREHPPATVEEIVEGTGWIHHVVDMAVRLMVERRLVQAVTTAAGETAYAPVDP